MNDPITVKLRRLVFGELAFAAATVNECAYNLAVRANRVRRGGWRGRGMHGAALPGRRADDRCGTPGAAIAQAWRAAPGLGRP